MKDLSFWAIMTVRYPDASGSPAGIPYMEHRFHHVNVITTMAYLIHGHICHI